jgi:hypothetical protein
MRNSKVIGAGASLATLGATALLLFSTRQLPPGLDPKPHEATGWVMAQEALGLLKPGGWLVVIRRDTGAYKHPESDLQFKSFQKALRKAKATVTAVRAVGLDPLRPLEVPPGDFFELIRRSPAECVIVSFLGPPLLSQDQRRQLGQSRPKIIAFCPGPLPAQIDLRVLFEARLLEVAVISRRNPPQFSAKPKDLAGWFDRYYQKVTAAEVARLYVPASGPP